MRVTEKPTLCPIRVLPDAELTDWEARFRESRALGARVDACWRLSDDERRMGLERLREVCTYDPVDDEIERHYLREPDPEIVAADDVYYMRRYVLREL